MIQTWSLTHEGIYGNTEIFAYAIYYNYKLVALFKVKGSDFCYDIQKNI